MKTVQYKDVRLIIPAISDLKPKQWYDNKPGISQNLVTLLGILYNYDRPQKWSKHKWTVLDVYVISVQ